GGGVWRGVGGGGGGGGGVGGRGVWRVQRARVLQRFVGRDRVVVLVDARDVGVLHRRHPLIFGRRLLAVVHRQHAGVRRLRDHQRLAVRVDELVSVGFPRIEPRLHRPRRSCRRLLEHHHRIAGRLQFLIGNAEED